MHRRRPSLQQATSLIGLAQNVGGVLGPALAGVLAQWETTLGRLIPGAALSRVTSLNWVTTVGLMPLGYAIAGPIAEAAGLHATMIGASVISFALFLAALAVEDVRTVPQESIAS